MRGVRASLLLAFSTVLAGCGEDPPATPPTGDVEPALADVLVGANEHNALSTSVLFSSTGADSARVVYTKGENSSVTPWCRIEDGSHRIVTLGLEPSSAYEHVVEVRGPGGEASSEPVSFSTGELPPLLRRVAITIWTPRPSDEPPTPAGAAPPDPEADGYTLANIRHPEGDFAIAFDDSGHIRWYRHWDIMGGFSTQLSNGNFATFLGGTTGAAPEFGYFAEYTPAGDVVARHQAPVPLYTDNHELLMTRSDDGYEFHLLSYDIRRVDTTPIGGVPDARIAGHQILRIGASGVAEYMWNTWDHYDIEDWVDGPPAARTQDEGDFDHPNSLDIDHDGHYILSIRNFGAITKIDSRTGELIWQLGGRNNEFTFVNDPLGGFNAQHFARILDNGNLLLFDNGMHHQPQISRAVEYALDTDAMTATLVHEMRRDPDLYTGFLGSAQRLSNGNTLVGFGVRGIASKFNTNDKVVWEAALTVDGFLLGVYRFIRIASLYEYAPP